jgi:hypothetical protein
MCRQLVRGLALETLPGLGIIRKTRGQNFDGNGAIKPGIAGSVHLSHSARAEASEDFVRSELRAGGEGHPCAPLYSLGTLRAYMPLRGQHK